jgi:hypothetical protein
VRVDIPDSAIVAFEYVLDLVRKSHAAEREQEERTHLSGAAKD